MEQQHGEGVDMQQRRLMMVAGLAVTMAIAGGALVYACEGHGSQHSGDTGIHQVEADRDLISNGQWDYMPGVSVRHDTLRVQHRGFNIVEQDGSAGQANPPINLYGTRLKISGGFAVSATLSNIHGPASLQLYGSVPRISDEFRVEPPSVRLTVEDGSLKAQTWDGKALGNLADQKPTDTQTFSTGSTDTIDLKITDSNGQLKITEDGKDLGAMPDSHIFDSGELWFGADAEADDGSFSITHLRAEPVDGGSVSAVNTAADDPANKDPNGLQQLADRQRRGFLIGTDAALWAAVSDPQYNKVLLGGNFGIVTPENAMKWQFTEPETGVYDFHEADALVDLALKNDMKVHGHNLVFSEALPKWVQTLPTDTTEQKAYVRQILVDHVKTLVDHFKGRVDEWDINEIFADYDDNGDLPQTFRDNVFYRAMGADYVKIVAEAAHEANPKVKLYINDYGAEADTGPRWAAILNTLKQWKGEGVPIYGFGFESHIYDASTDAIVDNSGNAPTLDAHINAFAVIGLKSRISEMDVTADNGEAWRANQFKGVLHVCISNPNCVAFSIWSVGPTDLWQEDNHSLQQTSVDSPFGQDMKPNESYTVLQSALK